MINKFKWKINFIKSSNDSYILPFYCLLFGVLFQQTFSFLFLYVCCDNESLSIIFCSLCVLLDIFVIYKIKRVWLFKLKRRDQNFWTQNSSSSNITFSNHGNCSKTQNHTIFLVAFCTMYIISNNQLNMNKYNSLDQC